MGATGIGTATGLPAGVSAAWVSNTITISGTPTSSGTFTYIIPLTGGCGTVNATGTITVTTANTVGAASSTPTLYINTALTNITHVTTGATGIGTATGLPAGVSAAWVSNKITISGTPTASGTFNYNIPLTGGCGTVNATGTITVTPAITVGAASSTPTLCINTALTNIMHATTGATGIGTAIGLPAGVSAAWASNKITISGTPTASGIFTYIIPLTGGGTVHATGTITVIKCINFSGKLKYSRDLSTGVGNDTVTLLNTANNVVLDTKLIPADGLYSLTATNIANGSFSIKPFKNVMMTNGLTSADALRINQHVSASNRFTDPFDLVAADVNRNNTVSTQDALLVNGIVLGNPQVLLKFNATWRFIPQNHKLPTNPAPAQPLNPVPAGFWTFPEQLNYTGINADQIDQDFVGIKLGDVDTPNGNPANRGLKPLIWKVEDQELAVGSDILVSFNAEGFRYLAALQFALGFNTGYLEYKGVQTSARMPLNQTHFGAYNAAAGELRTSWYSTATVSSVRNGLTVFQLQFKVLKAGAKLSDVLYLDTNLLLAEAYSEELVPHCIRLEFTQGSRLRDISAAMPFTARDRLLQNQPNPFGTSTQIEFELREACDAVLSVYDASGRLLWEDHAYREAGSHSVTYISAEVQAPGIMYYTLRTPGATLTQKMVMVRLE